MIKILTDIKLQAREFLSCRVPTKVYSCNSWSSKLILQVRMRKLNSNLCSYVVYEAGSGFKRWVISVRDWIIEAFGELKVR